MALPGGHQFATIWQNAPAGGARKRLVLDGVSRPTPLSVSGALLEEVGRDTLGLLRRRIAIPMPVIIEMDGKGVTYGSLPENPWLKLFSLD